MLEIVFALRLKDSRAKLKTKTFFKLTLFIYTPVREISVMKIKVSFNYEMNSESRVQSSLLHRGPYT
ncbi:protein of unknown function [Legionella fallonii LLAP-10]|uniref:Uncharacterized protein n=1 Tax=Legionella fallonii LLAP-10 TaxID=1212491 RepID=A0A098G7C6_9GAMM|nr:protein of unknown function [Legionella fallonii LLAP-10]